MVLISNMDMPKSCINCKLCKDYISKVWCVPTGNPLVRWNVSDKRHEDCPLVELIDLGRGVYKKYNKEIEKEVKDALAKLSNYEDYSEYQKAYRIVWDYIDSLGLEW